MENQDLILLSKFAVAARKIIGPINPAKLLRDTNYSEDIFQQVDALGDEALILLSLSIQEKLGLFPGQDSAQKISQEQSEKSRKYIYGARG